LVAKLLHKRQHEIATNVPRLKNWKIKQLDQKEDESTAKFHSAESNQDPKTIASFQGEKKNREREKLKQ
jgi:hypothetical protein